MKTRTSVSILILVLVVAVSFIFTSCDNNGGSAGHIIYDGTEYPIAVAFIGEVGIQNGAYGIGLTAASTGIDIEAMTGIGEAIWISIFSPTLSLAVGTYNISLTENPYTFDDFWVFINYNAETDVGDLYVTISGTLTVTESGADSVSFEFEVTLDNGKTCTGMYSGSATIS